MKDNFLFAFDRYTTNFSLKGQTSPILHHAFTAYKIEQEQVPECQHFTNVYVSNVKLLVQNEMMQAKKQSEERNLS